MTSEIEVVHISMRQLQEALDDLWGCIGATEIADLQPETVAIARENHQRLWHADA